MPRLRAIMLTLICALAAPGAHAQRAATLPDARKDVWTAERLVPKDPPGINGAIAQIRGQGLFGVICERGDDIAYMIYRPPHRDNPALLERGDEITVEFVFDGTPRDQRTMKWDEEAAYWRGNFGPTSKIANAMKRFNAVRLRVRGPVGVASDFTLNGSWNSIERMFKACKM